MNSREIAAEIKMRVSMRDICERYGLNVNGAGFINCPFHSGDNTASLKIYRGNKGWHCFGCGAGGFQLTRPMRARRLQFLYFL